MKEGERGESRRVVSAHEEQTRDIPPPFSPPRSPFRATLFDLLTSPLSFSLPSRLRFLFLSPSSFPLPLSFSYRGVSTRILVNTAGSSFHVESSNASRGYNNWFGASLARFDTRVPFCLAASTCVGRFLAYLRSLARLPLSIVMHALARLLSASLYTETSRTKLLHALELVSRERLFILFILLSLNVFLP